MFHAILALSFVVIYFPVNYIFTCVMLYCETNVNYECQDARKIKQHNIYLCKINNTYNPVGFCKIIYDSFRVGELKYVFWMYAQITLKQSVMNLGLTLYSRLTTLLIHALSRLNYCAKILLRTKSSGIYS